MALPDPILDRLPDPYRQAVLEAFAIEDSIVGIGSRIRTLEAMRSIASTAAWPAIVKVLDEEIAFTLRRLETADAKDVAAVARLQGRLDAYRMLRTLPEHSGIQVDNLRKRGLELEQRLKTVRGRPEVLWYDRRAQLEKRT